MPLVRIVLGLSRSGRVFFAAQPFGEPPYEDQPVERPLIFCEHLMWPARSLSDPA